MTPQDAQYMVAACRTQQERQNRDDAAVTFFIRGKWSANSDRKRLDGRRGPLGHCCAEYEDAVMVGFKANEVIAYCAQFVPMAPQDVIDAMANLLDRKNKGELP